MARKRMVTRTVVQTKAEVMCLNVITAEVSINTYTIGGSYDSDSLLKALKPIFETDELKLVSVQDYTEAEILLGMDEDEFIRLAKVLPPRTNTGKEAE